jgi:hypothetical protein
VGNTYRTQNEVLYDPWADNTIPRRHAEDGWPTPDWSNGGGHYFEQLDRALMWRRSKVAATRYSEWLHTERERQPFNEFQFGGGFWLGGRTWPVHHTERTDLPPSDRVFHRSLKPAVLMQRWLDNWENLPPFHPQGEEGGGDTCVLILERRPSRLWPHIWLCEFQLALNALGDTISVAKAARYGKSCGVVKLRGWQTAGRVPVRAVKDWDHI